jgi:NAD(P)-dependent dehydrogenase (short-subunit alcohol dehydrogenase family)
MTGKRAVIFGASGGIGAALVAQLENSDRYGAIHSGSRNLPDTARPKTIPFAFDLCNEASIAQAAQAIGEAGPLDLAFVATGMLHSTGSQMPEKSSRALDAEAMAQVFAINTFGPAIIAKHFLPLMRRDERSVFAVLSARVGSIGDNRLGGWHSYRASKAALNMLVRNFAIEFAARNPRGIVVAVHPGTVNTELSRPFKRAVPEGALFEPKQSAMHMLAMLESLSPNDSGGLFAWSGERIPY